VASEKRRTEQRSWLRAEIQKGIDSGPAGPLDMEDVIRSGRARVAARKRRRTQASPLGLMPRAIELSEAALADFDQIYDSIGRQNIPDILDEL
jgi:hypothetical protein